MVEKVPADVEAKYNKYIQLKETQAALSQERIMLEGTLAEIDSIIEKIKELEDDVELYKMVGNVLVKSRKDSILKELEDRKEDLEIRLKAIKSQEDSIKKELDRLAEELKRLLGGGGGKPGAAG
ncbi:MAG: prefoldin subunit beta [Desulfurococcales archaeon]|nr:prefoldin subunit beta [Desulfurococcales archaeon]MCE4605560.1 prefoldin subunit beta [Desulfurococcales archaeon]